MLRRQSRLPMKALRRIEDSPVWVGCRPRESAIGKRKIGQKETFGRCLTLRHAWYEPLNATGADHDFLARAFLRQAAFLGSLYGDRGPEWAWNGAALYLSIVLANFAGLGICFVSAYLPGEWNLAVVSPLKLTLVFALAQFAIAIWVDRSFVHFKQDMTAARDYSSSRDGWKLVLSMVAMLAAIAGIGLLLWWKRWS